MNSRGIYGRGGMKQRLYIALILSIAFLIAIIVGKFNDNTYYFLYPQLTYEYTWGTIIITAFLTVVMIYVYRIYRVRLKRKLILYSFFILAGLLNTAFLIGGMQYLIYLADKDSFVVDADVKNYELKIEKNTLTRITYQLIQNRAHCIAAVHILKRERLKISKKKYASSFWRVNYTVTAYQIKGRNITITLERIWNHTPEDPRKPDTTHTTVYGYNIGLFTKPDYFEFATEGESELELARFFESPFIVDRSGLIVILNRKISELDKGISTLKKNVGLIEKRGIPFRQFVYDSFMKILQQNPEIFKTLSWKSRLLSGLSLMITSIILFPFISDIFERWKNRVPR